MLSGRFTMKQYHLGIKNVMDLHIVRDLAKAIGCRLKVTSQPAAA